MPVPVSSARVRCAEAGCSPRSYRQQRCVQKQAKPKGALAKAAAASAQKVEEPAPVVPINWKVQPHVRSVVITGPNTGGKTAALKALGLSALLAMCGCGVPARAPARLPPFSAVLADIGDSQVLTRVDSPPPPPCRAHPQSIQGVGSMQREYAGCTYRE